MRTLLGSVALCVGGFLLLIALFVVLQFPGLLLWVSGGSGGLGIVLMLASLILLRTKSHTPGRGVIVGLSLLGGLAGFIFAVGSKNYDFGKHCGIEGSKLTVRVFGRVLHEESQPAVQQIDSGHTFTGPPQDLKTRMVCWELGLDTALIAGGAFVGGLLGVAIRLGLKKS